MNHDPGTSAYERARVLLANELRAIGKSEPGSRFTEDAAALKAGHLMRVQTWVALQAIARLVERDGEGEGA